MKSHIGERKRSRQNLTLEIKRWTNRENVQIEILETTERRWVTYHDFRKGRVYADFIHYPFHNDCTFAQAKMYTIAILSLTIMALAGIIYLFS